MILKIYSIISILTYIMFKLANARCTQEYKSKYDIPKDKTGRSFITRIRLVMVCFVPIFNIFFLLFWTFIFLFANEKYLEKEIFSRLNRELKDKEV